MKQEVTPIDGFHYSTSEQFTGKYWIDGKKIYQKTWDLGNNVQFPTGETQFGTDQTVKLVINGKYTSNGGNNYALWSYANWSADGTLWISNKFSYTANVRYITWEYTKTTD